MGTASLVAALATGPAVIAQDISPSPQPPPPSAPTSAPATVDRLVAGLLQVGDLPSTMSVATDVQEGTDYDIDDAAFMAQDGIRIVERTWGADADEGASLVFDFRMQFPTAEAASAYLAAALPTLSEVDATGLQPLPDATVIGDESHAYGLDTQGDSGPVAIRSWVFRVGPVVAKILAGGPGLTGDQIAAMAQAAAARMAATGPPAPGSPRPDPTPAPSASAMAPLPSGDLVELLVSHLPASIVPTCSPDEQRLWEGELVTLVCSPADADVQATYSGFDTAAHMQAAYQSSLDTIDLSDIAESCDLGTWTGSYQADGEAIGQVTCWSEPNGRAIMWADDRLSILSVAVSPSLDPAGLYLWWLGAGPDL